TEGVQADDHDHVIKKNLRLVEHLGCMVSGEFQFPIALSSEEEQFAKEQVAQLEGRFAILNPRGGWPTKLWDAAGYAAIADRLFENCGVRSVVPYGPGEKDLAQSIVDQSKSGAAVVVDSTLKQFFALSKLAMIFIGGDTGPMHLAAAAHTPIVAIFGPTSARRNGPFYPNDIVVERDDLDCRTDCYRRSCSHISCMKIPADAVWQAVIRRLQLSDNRGDNFGD